MQRGDDKDADVENEATGPGGPRGRLQPKGFQIDPNARGME
jgi:hypothetical protein